VSLKDIRPRLRTRDRARSGWLASVVVLVALVAPVGCGGPEPVPPLRVGLVVFPGFEPIFLARSMGLFSDEDIQLVDQGAAADALRAFRNGTVDVVGFTTDFAIEAMTTHPTTRIIYTPDVSLGVDAVVAGPGIATVADLRGKRVGLEASTLGLFMLSRALDHAGLEWDDVEQVSIDIPDQVAAVAAGRVDAVVTYDPSLTQLLNMGQHVVYSSAEIPGEVVDVLIVREELFATHSRQLQLLVDSWSAGIEEMRRRPLESARIVVPREHVSPEEFLQALEGLQLLTPDEIRRMFVPAGSTSPLMETLERVMAVMLDRGILDEAVDVSVLVDDRFVVPR